MSIRTGIYRYSHRDDSWTERIDIETKIGTQVLKWEPVEDEAVPLELQKQHVHRRRKAGVALATVAAMAKGLQS